MRKEILDVLLITLLVVPPCAQSSAIYSFQSDSIKFVVHISVDGLRPDAVTALGPERAPNFYRLRTEGAFTDNARTDIDLTNTLPNHADILTGRRIYGSQGHGVDFNDTHPGTFASVHGSYVAGVFDVAHDNGLRTGLFYSKDKFDFYARSWDADHGLEDTVGVDNGRAKIDRVVFKDDTQSLTDDWLNGMNSEPYQYSFIHFRNPDTDGHARGWMSARYLDAIAVIDGYLGQIFERVETDPALAGRTAIVLVADHGGSGTDHQTAGDPLHFTIPQYVWGPGVKPASDLYELNWATRKSFCMAEPGISAPVAPIRNGGSGNLALSLLGLPAIPGSTINKEQDLAIDLPVGVTLPEVTFQSPDSDDVFLTGEPISFSVTTTPGSAATAYVVYTIGCDTVGTASEPPFAIEYAVAPPGSHIARATVFDADGRFGSDTVTVKIEAFLSVDGSDTDWLALGVKPTLDTDSLQADPELALDRLFIREDIDTFYFGFDAAARTKTVSYGLYLDLDAVRVDQESDPMGFAVRAARPHTPEMAFYFVQDGWSADAASFFELDPSTKLWSSSSWPSDFSFAADTSTRFIEFAFPKNVVSDYSGEQGFFAQLFTVGETGGAGASESIPSDAGIGFTEENTSTGITIVSEAIDFNFPPFPGDKIFVDGVRFDWTRANFPSVNSDKLQTDPDLALDRLFVTHDLDHFYFGFTMTPGSKQSTFGLYIDSGIHDNPDWGAGGPGSANGNAVDAVNFLPDVQLYFDNDSTGTFSDDTPRYYVWDNLTGNWGTVTTDGPVLPFGSEFAVGAFGGTSFVEFSIPRTSPGFYDAETIKMALFSVGETPAAGASASIPPDPNVQFAVENTSTDVTFLSTPHVYSVKPLVVRSEESGELPVGLELFQNYPNPFATSTAVSFAVDRTQRVKLAAYDMLGRLQIVLFDEMTNPGTQRVDFDASELASGTYILRLEGDNFGQSRTVIVVR